MEFNRESAWALVTEWSNARQLFCRMLAVEAAMRAYAQRFGEDQEKWRLVGLLHDFDYGRYPDLTIEGQPVVGTNFLREQGASEEITHAILAHAEEYTGVAPETRMEKTLVAVDELTGFITAVTLVRPSKQIADVELSSIKKKWKAKEFAAAVNRQEIEHAAESIRMPLHYPIAVLLPPMKPTHTTLR